MTDSRILIQWEPLEGQTFNPEFSGYTAAHYATGNPELGWCLYSRGAGACWHQRTKQIKAPSLDHQPERIDGCWYWLLPEKHSKEALSDSLDSYISREEIDLHLRLVELERIVTDAAIESVQNWRATNLFYRVTQESKLVAAVDAVIAARALNDKIPEVKYLGSTQNGERYRVPPEGVDNFNTVPPRILNSKVAATFRELPIDFPPLEARVRCERCGEQISRQADGEPWEHDSNKSIYCPNDDTGCSIATPISEPGASIAEVATVPRRYLQLTDYEKEGQLFQIEFREDLFELKVQNENGKPVTLTLTERELRDAAKHPVDTIRDFMIDAGVPADLIDEGAAEDARRECDEPLSDSQRYSQASAYCAAGMQRVANDPPPAGQKYAPGARVRIADDLGLAMRHFPKGRMATVLYTYAHAFGGDDVTSYCLDVDGVGKTSWYKEDQLTLVDPPEFPSNVSIREGDQPK